MELGAATGQWAASQGGKPNALAAAAGVAAGVAAGFDAPTAAVAFALESDTKNADTTAAFSAITAAGVASYVSRALLGVPSTTRKGSKGLAAVATNWKLFDVGPLMSVAQDVVIASFVAAVFAKALRTSADLFKRAPPSTTPWMQLEPRPSPVPSL